MEIRDGFGVIPESPQGAAKDRRISLIKNFSSVGIVFIWLSPLLCISGFGLHLLTFFVCLCFYSYPFSPLSRYWTLSFSNFLAYQSSVFYFATVSCFLHLPHFFPYVKNPFFLSNYLRLLRLSF